MTRYLQWIQIICWLCTYYLMSLEGLAWLAKVVLSFKFTFTMKYIGMLYDCGIVCVCVCSTGFLALGQITISTLMITVISLCIFSIRNKVVLPPIKHNNCSLYRKSNNGIMYGLYTRTCSII